MDYNLEILSCDTAPGVFLTANDQHIWVFNSTGGRVAVHVEGDRHIPRFGYCYLNQTPYRLGQWYGKWRIYTGAFNAPNHRERCGQLCRYQGQVFLKANSPQGKADYLALLDYKSEDVPGNNRAFCDDWLLSIEFSSEFLVGCLDGEYVNYLEDGLPELSCYPSEYPEGPTKRDL